MDTLKRWWDGIGRAFEAFDRAQRPWEREGPLHWVKPLGGSWELHGATAPVEVEAEQTPVWSPLVRVRW